MKCSCCDREFIQTTKIQKYCSDNCQKKASQIRRRDESKPKVYNRICPYCKVEFEARFHHRVYCSKLCALKAARERDDYSGDEASVAEIRAYYGLPPIKKGETFCLSCGKEFYSEDLVREQICSTCKDRASNATFEYIGSGVKRNGYSYIELEKR